MKASEFIIGNKYKPTNPAFHDTTITRTCIAITPSGYPVFYYLSPSGTDEFTYQESPDKKGNYPYTEYNEPRKISGWLNIYEGCIVKMHCFHLTKEKANLAALKGRVACIYVSGEEGVEPKDFLLTGDYHTLHWKV